MVAPVVPYGSIAQTFTVDSSTTSQAVPKALTKEMIDKVAKQIEEMTAYPISQTHDPGKSQMARMLDQFMKQRERQKGQFLPSDPEVGSW